MGCQRQLRIAVALAITPSLGINIADPSEVDINNHEMIVAVANSLFNSWGKNDKGISNICGKQVEIKDPATGKTQIAKVQDSCTGCPEDGLDLTPDLFSIFGDHSIGVFNNGGNSPTITWRFLDGSGSDSTPEPKPEEPKPEPKPEEQPKPEEPKPEEEKPKPEEKPEPKPEEQQPTTPAPAEPSATDGNKGDDDHKTTEENAPSSSAPSTSTSSTDPTETPAAPTSPTTPPSAPTSTWVSSLSSASGNKTLTPQFNGTSQVPSPSHSSGVNATATIKTTTASITGAGVPGAPPAAHEAVITSSSSLSEADLDQSNIYALQQLIVRLGQAVIYAAIGA